MYFSRIRFNSKADRTQVIQYFSHNSYREHQKLWKFFDDDPNARRDFLFYRDKNVYYVVSKRLPRAFDDLWIIDGSKNYNPFLEAGQKLSFKSRFNPIVTKDKRRIDVVTYKKMQMGYRSLPQSKRPDLNYLTTEACAEWLKKRSGHHGFSFNSSEIIIHSYQKNRAWKKDQKSITYYSADVDGILTIVDVDKFKNTLFKGIGKGRAFGCGLMLIKRV